MYAKLTMLFKPLLPLLATQGTTILMTILGILVIVFGIGLMIILSKIIKPICDYFEALAEKHLSEKIGRRVAGAIDNLENVLLDLVIAEKTLIEKLGKEAYQNDGVIDLDELKYISKKVADLAIKRIEPDHNTFKKYISGNLFYDYVIDKANNIITQAVSKVLEKNIGKK